MSFGEKLLKVIQLLGCVQAPEEEGEFDQAVRPQAAEEKRLKKEASKTAKEDAKAKAKEAKALEKKKKREKKKEKKSKKALSDKSSEVNELEADKTTDATAPVQPAVLTIVYTLTPPSPTHQRHAPGEVVRDSRFLAPPPFSFHGLAAQTAEDTAPAPTRPTLRAPIRRSAPVSLVTATTTASGHSLDDDDLEFLSDSSGSVYSVYSEDSDAAEEAVWAFARQWLGDNGADRADGDGLDGIVDYYLSSGDDEDDDEAEAIHNLDLEEANEVIDLRALDDDDQDTALAPASDFIAAPEAVAIVPDDDYDFDIPDLHAVVRAARAARNRARASRVAPTLH